MVDWAKIKKIDAHVHIVPDAVHQANADAEDVWVFADIHSYQLIMNENNIAKAVIMPLNDPWLMSMEFTVSAVHRNLYEMKKKYPDKFYAFADVDTRNTSDESAKAICRAIDEYGLDGIKLHPNNTGVALDAVYNHAIFAFAQRRDIPVAVHSYPDSAQDFGSAERIVNVFRRYPDLTMIVSHMGAYQWKQILSTPAYVDISAILPDYVHHYGMEKTKEILCCFGADRLIFATDYPTSRILHPNAIYGTYFEILNQLDFSEEEAEKIAYQNIERILTKRTENGMM